MVLIGKKSGVKYSETFFRFCNECNKRYKPDGKAQKICNKCISERKFGMKLKSSNISKHL